MKICLIIILLLLIPYNVYAQPIEVSIPITPPDSESLTVPVPAALSSILKAAKVRFKMKSYPFQRFIKNVTERNHDFPITEIPFAKKTHLKYGLSNTFFWKVPFVLCTQADKPPIDIGNMRNYKISTDLARQIIYDIQTTAAFSLMSAIKLVAIGLMDGFLFAATLIDPIKGRLKLFNIRRTLLAMFNVNAALKLANNNAVVYKDLHEGIS